MSSFPRPLPFAEDIETIPVDEAEDTQRVIEALKVILVRSQAKTGQFRGDVHVKTHGYVPGEFRVLPNLPEELAQGLFRRDAIYPAVVRFSNASSQPQADVLPDARGFALKVLGIEQETILEDQPASTQDFVMINHPVFFSRNVKDYLRLEQVLVEANDNPVATIQGVLTGGDWNPLHWHWREMMMAARIAGQLPTHPVNQIYFSTAPIRYGDYVAKYRVKPLGDRSDSYLALVQKLGTQADAMRLALEETLRSHEVLFEFQVQLRTSAETMPIEDPTIEWPEQESPYRTVAHLLLPRQEMALLREQRDYQQLAFNIWHALAAHRPLGGINRLRRRVYAVSADWRRQRGLETPVSLPASNVEG